MRADWDHRVRSGRWASQSTTGCQAGAFIVGRWAGGKPVLVRTFPRLGAYGLTGITW